MFYRRGILALIFLLAIPQILAAWIDESQSILLPSTVREAVLVPEQFPVFWKGVFIGEVAHALELKLLCQKLSEAKFSEFLSEVYCDYRNVRSNRILEDWRDDVPLREKLPSVKEFTARALGGLALASLPATPHSMIEVLRADPFQSAQKLLAIRSQLNLFKWSQGDGVFLSVDEKLAFFPVTFNFSPKEFKKTEEFLQLVQADFPDLFKQVELTGPHAAAVRNRSQVMKDLSLVTWLGVAFLLVLLASLGKKNGFRFFMLFLPPLFAVGITMALTVVVFGSIHGLTLSFGPALIGLALDYGIYASVHRSSPASWRTNRMGMLTTLSGFVILSFSQIIFIRQLMFFAIVGLLLTFVLYRILMTRTWFKGYLDVLRIKKRGLGWGTAISWVLLMASIVLWLRVPIDLNLQKLEYRTRLQRTLEKKFWASQGNLFPLYLVHEAATKSEEFEKELKWSQENQIAIDSVAQYIPSPASQTKNLSGWMTEDCEKNLKLNSPELKTFYQPFSQRMICRHPPKVFDFENAFENGINPPVYVAHLFSDDKKSLSFWLARDLGQQEKILEKYPKAYSFRNLLSSFPKILMRELGWMFPVTLLFCAMLLAFHYRKLKGRQQIKAIALAMLPLFTAVGAILSLLTVLGHSLSFVSLVGLLMVFGASVDYGIFNVDQILSQGESNHDATFTALYIAATTTFLGYLPLIFGKHPVLNNLGMVLSSGVVGALIGSVWAIPYFAKKWTLKSKDAKSL